MNNERKNYLKKVKTKKITIICARIAILLGVIIFWEIATLTGLADAFFFSSPSRIFKLFISMAGSELWMHILTTLKECLLAFCISTVIGIALAVLLWWSDYTRQILDPYVVVANSLPKIALGPLIIIWAGTGQKAIVTMAVLICVIVTVISVLSGFLATDEDKIFLLRSMGASKRQIFFKLVFPSALPDLISSMKVGVGLAWVGTIMGEYLVSSAGLGYLIIYGGAVFNLDLVMMSTVILCLLAALMYFAVAFLEKKFTKFTK